MDNYDENDLKFFKRLFYSTIVITLVMLLIYFLTTKQL